MTARRWNQAEAERLRAIHEPPPRRMACGCLAGAHPETLEAIERAHPRPTKETAP